MELTLSELQEMATRQQQQIEAQQQMLIAKVSPWQHVVGWTACVPERACEEGHFKRPTNHSLGTMCASVCV